MSDTTMANSQLIPLVQLSGLTKVYQEGEQSRVVLTDVHATVQRGELAVLLGPSGSGKSTLLNLISGVDLPKAGRESSPPGRQDLLRPGDPLPVLWLPSR